MKEEALIVWALFVGISNGLLFFGGLWWTVQKSISTKQPALLFAGSYLLRTLFALTIFYLIGRGNWQRLLVCLIGFIAGRVLVNRFSQIPQQTDYRFPEEGVR
jgi:F1F0 ATPase subunit 2